jgi:hypothetical protein
MMSEPTSTAKVRAKACELLAVAPKGIRYMELHRTIAGLFPDIPKNTIFGSLHKFRTNLPADIQVVTKGLYRHIKFTQAQEAAAVETAKKPKIREEDFYQPFADWLENELEECTKAIALGGARFGNKWGTPDVIGVRVASRDDLIKFQEEVTSAEIKIDTQGLITAFGQACAYKLFSHRSYIVVPKASPQEDRDRLTALSQIFGIGLVFFNANSLDQPEFDIQVRAARNEPDYFYLNQNLRMVKDELF